MCNNTVACIHLIIIHIIQTCTNIHVHVYEVHVQVYVCVYGMKMMVEWFIGLCEGDKCLTLDHLHIHCTCIHVYACVYHNMIQPAVHTCIHVYVYMQFYGMKMMV